MGDATSNPTSPSKVALAFFKQHKRKIAADLKGADAPKIKITNTNQAVEETAQNNGTNSATPSTNSTMEPTAEETQHDFVIEDVALAEIRTNAISEHLLPPMSDDIEISDEELEHHLAHLERESIQTIVHNGLNGRQPIGTGNVGHGRQSNEYERRVDERERGRLVYKLDNLNDKKTRYLSHESFLKKCLDNNVVPNGLRVFVEPSIGNRNEQFLNEWHELLEGFSRTLTTKVIEFCNAEVQSTETEFTATASQLQTITTASEFDRVLATVAINEKSRVNDLISRKNRKFYRLKHNNNFRNDRNEGRIPNGGNNENRNNNDNRRDRRGNSRNNRNLDDRVISDRSDYNSETDQSDQENLLAIIDRRNNRRAGRNENLQQQKNFRGDVNRSTPHWELKNIEHRNDVRFRDQDRTRREYDNTNNDVRSNRRDMHTNDARGVVNDVRSNRRDTHTNDASRGVENDVRSRRDTSGHSSGSYAAAVRNEAGPSRDSNYNSDSEPIHEKISLIRRNSRRSIRGQRDQPPTRQPANPRQADQEELEMLRSKVRSYESQTNQTSDTTPQPPKNEGPARRETGQKNELSEMRSYLAGVMNVIKEFDNKLSSQHEQPPIPSDRS